MQFCIRNPSQYPFLGAVPGVSLYVWPWGSCFILQVPECTSNRLWVNVPFPSSFLFILRYPSFTGSHPNLQVPFFTKPCECSSSRPSAFSIRKQEDKRGRLINMQCHNILSHSNIWYIIKCINSEHHKYLWLHLSMKANEFPLAWVSLEINFNVTKCISQEMFDVAQLAYESLIYLWFTP